MANGIEFSFPIFGINKGEAVSKQPNLTSGHMNNVRPYDVLETRRRGGQRPGLDKMYSQQIGESDKAAVVWLGEIRMLI